MRKVVEARGRTVEEAIQQGLAELDASRDQVKVEVLEESTKGLFGILGGKEAVVRLTYLPHKAEVAGEFVRDVISAMDLDAVVEVSDDGEYIFVNVVGVNLGGLIGRRGQTLDALQYLINLVASKHSEERQRVILDIEGYRKRREQTLRRLAERVADQVRRTGQRVALEPMSAQERRIIHLALQDNPYVTTLSEGEEPYRNVVVEKR